MLMNIAAGILFSIVIGVMVGMHVFSKSQEEDTDTHTGKKK